MSTNYCEFTGDRTTSFDEIPRVQRVCEHLGITPMCLKHNKLITEDAEGWRVCCQECTTPKQTKFNVGDEMNTIHIKRPTVADENPVIGDMFKSDENLYMLVHAGDDSYVACRLNGPGTWSGVCKSIDSAVRGLAKLPKGTVVTITVGGADPR